MGLAAPHRRGANGDRDTTRSCENGLLKEGFGRRNRLPHEEPKVSEPTLDDRFDELRHTVDCEISRARNEAIGELARAVSRMRSAATEPEWHEAVLDSGRIFANEPAALDLLRSLAALTAPVAAGVVAERAGSQPIGSQPIGSQPGASQYADSNGRNGAGVEANAAALRFARVKIAEIQLYHAAAVKAGRALRDLYGSLKPHIDEARAEFRELFLGHSSEPNTASETTDYLHAEMLHALAHDDATLLGPNYPGPLA